MDAEKHALRVLLEEQLERQGFAFENGAISSINERTKAQARAVHAIAVHEARVRARPALERFEGDFLRSLATRRPLPRQVEPEVVLLPHGPSFDALLWRWVGLHWSIPVSNGYGRRMRFLIRDRANEGAVIGIVGLTDPVFSLKARDAWFEWSHSDRRTGLVHIMEAFALGAAPPYDSMLGGKLVAMVAASLEIATAFSEKYSGGKTRILERTNDGRLYALTTQSAFGRSSLYNRISAPDGQPLWQHVGLTRGTGDFHLGGELYERLLALAKEAIGPQARGSVSSSWKASGFRNRRDVLDVALRELGLDARVLRNHGVRRGVYVAPLVSNFLAVIRDNADPIPRLFSVDQMTERWADRWGQNAVTRPESNAESWRLY